MRSHDTVPLTMYLEKDVGSFHVHSQLLLAATLLHFAPVNRLCRRNIAQVIRAGFFSPLFSAVSPKIPICMQFLFSLALLIIDLSFPTAAEA